MLLKKYKKIGLKISAALTVVVCLLAIFGLTTTPAFAADVPAGCPGGPTGPAVPGTVCADGSIPAPDSSLPAGCPGSSKVGPTITDTICPARPGRTTCVLKGTKCITVDEKNLGLATDCNSADLNSSNCKIVWYLRVFINTLSAMVGIVIVIMITWGGIEFASAGNDPQRVSGAKNKITNALLALLVFIFMYAFLQWVIPGGLF